jgi:hypothetical protein
VLPDFVTTAGGTLGGLVPALDGERGGSIDGVRSAIGGVLGEVLTDEDGPLLAACRRAEAFLRTWRDDLPFGRPLA